LVKKGTGKKCVARKRMTGKKRVTEKGSFLRRPFADPSQTLRISSGLWLRALAQGFGSALRDI